MSSRSTIPVLSEYPPRWVESAREPVRLFARRTLIRNLAETEFRPRGAARVRLLERLKPLLELLEDPRSVACGPDEETAVRRAERYYWPPILQTDVELYVDKDEKTLLMLGGNDQIVIARTLQRLDSEDGELNAALERRLELLGGCAVDEDYGLLTSSPRRCGTGESVEIFLHLPALTATEQLGRMAQGAAETGFWLIPAGAPGAAVFVINNLCSLGYTSAELGQRAEALAKAIETAENSTRTELSRRAELWLEDRIGRAQGLAVHAQSLEEMEAATTCAWLRLGRTLELLPRLSWKSVNTALWALQPSLAAHEAAEAGTSPTRWRAGLLADLHP